METQPTPEAENLAEAQRLYVRDSGTNVAARKGIDFFGGLSAADVEKLCTDEVPRFVPLPFLGDPPPGRVSTGIGLVLQAFNETGSPPSFQAQLDLGHVRFARQGNTVIDDYYAAQIHCIRAEGHEGPHATNSSFYRGVEADVTSHRFDLSWEREPLARPEDDGPRRPGDVKFITSTTDET